MNEKASLKLIKGGRPKYYTIAGIRLGVTTREALPAAAEIMIFEEDTKMVLTVNREMLYKEEHPIRIMTDIHSAPKRKPGSLFIDGKNWYALVIDLDAGDVCQTRWIEEAYEEIFAKFNKKRIFAAGMHLLGSIYGKIPPEQAFAMFIAGLESRPPSTLEELFLVVNESQIKDIHRLAKEYGGG